MSKKATRSKILSPFLYICTIVHPERISSGLVTDDGIRGGRPNWSIVLTKVIARIKLCNKSYEGRVSDSSEKRLIMEFMLDTANLAAIEQFMAVVPVAGVTSNPSIIKSEGKIDFFEHMKQIRKLIGMECSLHAQVVSQTYEGMLADAHAILSQIDDQVYIKVPVSAVGLQVIKALKKQGVNVTATAIYTKFQGYLAIAAKADYIAPYFNRMENLNSDAAEAIEEMSREIRRSNSQTKILAASFKNVKQVNTALECGAHSATMGVNIISQAFADPSIQKAVDDFTSDWQAVYGETTISTLN